MATNKPNETSSELTAIAQRRRKVVELYLTGHTQYAIAEALGVSQTTICFDLKAIHQQWKEAAITDIAAIKERELLRIDRIEREHWRGWVKSLKDRQRRTTKSGGKEGDEVTSMTEGQAGNPRFLEGIMHCIERRARLLGLDAPEKIDFPNGIDIADRKTALQGILSDPVAVEAIQKLDERMRAVQVGDGKGGNGNGKARKESGGNGNGKR